MTRLAVLLLGPPRVERDGAVLKLDRRKSLALLAYLATTGQSHRRDSLVNLLWPDYDSAEGRAALRRTLHALNASLGVDAVAADREEVSLRAAASGPALWVDVVQFRMHLAQTELHGHPPAQTCPECVAPLSAAVDLAQGEFMAGFGLKDSANWDDWQLFQSQDLRRGLAGALDRLVRWHSSRREFDPALAFARRRLALDPLDEASHQELMRLYAWSGRRSAALRQYDECVAILRDQLGVQPQDATCRLHEEIQAGRPPPLPATLVPPPAELPAFLAGGGPVERPVFVARERELAQLGGHLQLALAGQGRVVLVTGEAGSGKTALIQEFARRAIETPSPPPSPGARLGQTVSPQPRPIGRGAMDGTLVVAVGNCNAYTGIGDPYLPFREILALMTGDVEARWAAGAISREHARLLWLTLPIAAQALAEAGPDLMDVLVARSALLERITACMAERPGWLARLEQPPERRPAGPVSPSPQQSDLFEQYTRVVQIVARRVPLVLVLDDLQWADLGSISFLFHLGRHLAGHRILVVGAFRPEEIAIGRDGDRHPLEAVVNELQRSFGEITINLDQAEGQGFLDALVDSEPNRLGAPFRQMLFRQTRGHPLFTVELLRGMQERGDLVHDASGRWIAGPALNPEALPARVEAAIRERLGRLPEPLRAAVRVASVEGEVFTAEVVTRVLRSDERAVVQSLSSELDRRHRLVRAQSIERLPSGRASRYRFRNYLFQRYLYDSLDQVERAYLHEDVGRALEELYGEQAAENAVELAWHFQEAGDAARAIRYLHQAGQRAVRLLAYREAVAHLSRGLDLLMAQPDTPERARKELELRLTLGVASIGVGTFTQEAGLAYARTRELGQQLDQVSELCQALCEMAIFYYVRAEHRRALELAQEALRQAEREGDPLLVPWSHWHVGFVLFGLGQFGPARDHLEQATACSTPAEHARSLRLLPGAEASLSARAYLACCLWCLGFPDRALAQSRETLLQARELGDTFTLADVLCYGSCVFSGMNGNVRELKDRAEELRGIAERIPTWMAPSTWHCGEAAARLGRLDEGIEKLQAGIATHVTADKHCDVPRVLGALARAQASAGRPDEGLARIAQALKLVEETGERYWEAELHRVKAELLLALGREAEAEASLHTAIDVARRQQARSWELRATTSLARLWGRQGRTAEAHERLAAIYGWFTEGLDTEDLREARATIESLFRDDDRPAPGR